MEEYVIIHIPNFQFAVFKIKNVMPYYLKQYQPNKNSILINGYASVKFSTRYIKNSALIDKLNV